MPLVYEGACTCACKKVRGVDPVQKRKSHVPKRSLEKSFDIMSSCFLLLPGTISKHRREVICQENVARSHSPIRSRSFERQLRIRHITCTSMLNSEVYLVGNLTNATIYTDVGDSRYDTADI
jgi:hypothetical protein